MESMEKVKIPWGPMRTWKMNSRDRYLLLEQLPKRKRRKRGALSIIDECKAQQVGNLIKFVYPFLSENALGWRTMSIMLHFLKSKVSK
jgi:hypothetical protein